MRDHRIVLSVEDLASYARKHNKPYIEDLFALFEHIPGLKENRAGGYVVQGGLFILILRRGSINLQVNYKKYTAQSPAVITLFQGVAWHLDSESPDAKMDVLSVATDTLTDTHYLPNFHFLPRMILSPVAIINDAAMSALKQYAQAIRKLYKLAGSPLRGPVSKILFYALLAEITANYEGTATGSHTKKEIHQKEVASSFFKILRETHPAERGVLPYAEKLCVSPQYLSTVVKETTGFPPIKWINNAILYEAKEMLKLTDLPVQQIAEKLHFRSAAFFICFFKRTTKTTPLSYRNKK